jgi:patatin-like phospholipase/acyl hydrolase
MSSKFRVLSLSGGGIRGVYTASFLAKLEELTGKRVADHFDVIVGTSTGGLIALAMGLKQTPESIRDFYLTEGSKIFPQASFVTRCLQRLGVGNLINPRYESDGLRDAVQKIVGTERTLGHSVKPLVISTFDAATGAPRCFKTRHDARYLNDWKLPAWEVGMATAAAPTYFRAFQSNTGADLIDGGVWANCPVLVGVIEAISVFGKERRDIDVLTVGTTRSHFSVAHDARTGGKWQYIRDSRVIELFMEANRASAMNMAQLLVGPNGLMEIDSVVERSRFELDRTRDEDLRDLRALGEHLAQTKAEEIKSRFFGTTAAPFNPVT